MDDDAKQNEDFKPPFDSQKIITERIRETDFNTFFVGFDIDDMGVNHYRWEPFVDVLSDVILEFALGLKDISQQEARQKLKEAAKAIYEIDAFSKAKERFLSDGNIEDDELDKKYLTRGEFGELILHLLLRDFHNTVPLLSKIYFKDSYNVNVHGFDAIHVDPQNKMLWLGESKIYVDPHKGIKSLIADVNEHINRDYLNQEFTIVSNKITNLSNIPEKKHWLDLMNSKTKLSEVLSSVTIPLLCVYTSNNLANFNEESEEFFKAYDKEVRELKKYFETNYSHSLSTKLNIILILFPVKCKKELVKRMHIKLTNIQGI
jgi:hypothetical protein